MDAGPSNHPTPETLQAYGLGKLDDASTEVVSKHLEECSDCRRQVTEMAPDSFLGRLRDAEEKHETSDAGRAVPVGPPPGETVAEDAPVNSSSSPAMSSTGLADATSDARSIDDDARLQAGTRVGYFGDYELLKVLGEGGMGTVYKARQLSLNRLVAVKMIKASRFPSSDEVRRFQNESEAVARLDHPNIVPVFEVGQYEDQHYFSMKLIAGESLDKKSKDYLANPRHAAELVAKMAGAIRHAHQRGILHRDLKPANILIDSEGQPHVTDFGLSKRVEGDSELTRSGAILGTPAYMAPEQASGKRGAVTTSTDVYGLGAVLYVLLTGRAPFGGDSVIDTLEQVRERPPEPPRKRNSRVPRDLEVICLKCLEKDPSRRYASAEALAEDFRHWLAGEPIVARPVGKGARLSMWCRRRPMVASLSAAVLVAIVVGLVGTSLSLLVALDAQVEKRKQTELAKLRMHESVKAQAKERIQTELAQMRLYDIGMNFVQRNWEDYTGKLVQQGLAERLPEKQGGFDRRGFEWFYWERKMSSGHITFRGHTLPVTCVTFDLDGNRLASAGDDGMVRVWDAWTGQQTFTLNAFAEEYTEESARHVTSVAFSPDGKRLASASTDGNVKVWDVLSGRTTLTLEGYFGVFAQLAFSTDGKWLKCASEGLAVRVWDAETGRENVVVTELTRASMGCVAFSPDSKRLACIDGKMVKLIDADTGQETFTFKGHTDDVTSVVFGPDGKYVASTSSDGTLKVWNAASGQQVPAMKSYIVGAWTVAFSPDCKRIACGVADTVKLWDAVTGQEELTLKGHTSDVTSLAFSPDGKRLASSSQDCTVKEWDAVSGQVTTAFDVPVGRVTNVAISPDGKRLVVSGGEFGVMQVWDADPVQEVPALRWTKMGAFGSAAFRPDGKQIVCSSYAGVSLWAAENGQETPYLNLQSSDCSSFAFSPDGKWLAGDCGDGTVRLWNTKAGIETQTLTGHHACRRNTAFSPDGKRIACGVGDTVKVWETFTGQETLTLKGHSSDVTSVAFSPDGSGVTSTSGDETLQLWDAATGQKSCTLKGHNGQVSCVAFSPNGNRIASGGADKTVKLWDTATGQETLTLRGHTGHVTSLAFSPDGDRIASASDDNTVMVWDGRPLQARPLSAERFSSRLYARIRTSRDQLHLIHSDVATAAADFVQALLLGYRDSNFLFDIAANDAVFDQVHALLPDSATSLSIELLMARAQYHAKVGRLDQARVVITRADDLAWEAGDVSVTAEPGRAVALLGCLERVYTHLNKHRHTTNPRLAKALAWEWALAPSAFADRELPVSLARLAATGFPAEQKYLALNALHTLGAVLYRAGRFDEAVSRLNEAIRLQGATDEIVHWPFLAMAHHRLGHRDDARRWLNRLRYRLPSDDPNRFWEELELGLLRSEAEAVILYDPIFPADPFAH